MKFHTGSNLYSIGSFFFRLVCSVFMILLGSCETKDVFLWLILTTHNNQSLLFIFPIIFIWKKKKTHMFKSAFEVYIIIIQICRNCMNFNLNNNNILTRYERKEQNKTALLNKGFSNTFRYFRDCIWWRWLLINPHTKNVSYFGRISLAL